MRSLFLTSALLLAVVNVGRAEDWAPNLTTSATWDSNASNSNRSADQIDSFELSADLLASRSFEYRKTDVLELSGHLAGSWWPRYTGLLQGAAGGAAEFRHQFGLSPRALVLSVEGTADAVAAKESGRRGVRTGAAVRVRKRLDDFTRATLSHEVSWFAARSATFDGAASTTALDLDRDLTDLLRVTLSAAFRDGDVVSYAAGARPDLEALAPHRSELATFGRPMTAYRVDARTWSGRIAVARALDENAAVIAAYELRQTERSPLRFTQHLFTISLVHQY